LFLLPLDDFEGLDSTVYIFLKVHHIGLGFTNFIKHYQGKRARTTAYQ
jgi:hypothetical protein